MTIVRTLLHSPSFVFSSLLLYAPPPQTTVAQLVRDDLEANFAVSVGPLSESIEAGVVASRDQVLPVELVDFEHPELAGLTCEELLARFIPEPVDAILEVYLPQYRRPSSRAPSGTPRKTIFRVFKCALVRRTVCLSEASFGFGFFLRS